MVNNYYKYRAKIFLPLFFVLLALLAAIFISSNANAKNKIAQIEKLEQQADILSRQLNGFMQNNNLQTLPTRDIAPVRVAQSARNLAALNVRISELEEQIRILTGQVEGLQFQMSQLQTFLERQQEDYEFRFQQLEGGELGKNKAAPSTIGVKPNEEVSQNQSENNAAIDLTIPNDVTNITDNGLDLSVPEQNLNILTEEINLSSQALDLSSANLTLVTKADADAQYKAGYEAVVRGDYAFAEEQFRQFIELFPTHPQAPDATNWLGEALILRGEYQEAADILLNGFQSYSASKRAPDILLKLGQALAGAGERITACRTFAEVSRRYPDISEGIRTRLAKEMAKYQC